MIEENEKIVYTRYDQDLRYGFVEIHDVEAEDGSYGYTLWISQDGEEWISDEWEKKNNE